MRLSIVAVAATRRTRGFEKQQPMIEQFQSLFLDELQLAVHCQHRAAQVSTRLHGPPISAKECSFDGPSTSIGKLQMTPFATTSDRLSHALRQSLLIHAIRR